MNRPRRFLRWLAARSEERRLWILSRMAQRLVPDYRLTWHQLDWWRDPEFNAYLDRFRERHGFNTHRKWTLWQLLRLIEDVEGDTAECGVFEGASSWLICAGTSGKGRMHHLFDSFEGLSEPSPADGGYWRAGSLAAGEHVVRENLRPFAGHLVFHKGWIPARFSNVAHKKFAFVHVDLDLGQPTRDSLEFFYSRLANGGILLCDDYGFATCPGVTEAIDGFLEDKPENMIFLDAGGGFFIKGTRTSVEKAPLSPPLDRRAHNGNDIRA